MTTSDRYYIAALTFVVLSTTASSTLGSTVAILTAALFFVVCSWLTHTGQNTGYRPEFPTPTDYKEPEPWCTVHETNHKFKKSCKGLR